MTNARESRQTFSNSYTPQKCITISVAIALASPPLGLLDGKLPLLFPQGDPHPQPTDHLDKHEGEKDPVLEEIAAPAGGVVRSGRSALAQLRAGRAHPSVAHGDAFTVQGGGDAKEEGVGGEGEGQEEAEGSYTEKQEKKGLAFRGLREKVSEGRGGGKRHF